MHVQILQSLFNPRNYSSHLPCKTFLGSHSAVLLQLTFSYFNLEPHSTCGWDSVTIFNGGSPGSPVIGQYCGTTSPGTIQSGSNKLAVVFLADHSVSRGGFMASWSADSSGGFTLAKVHTMNTHASKRPKLKKLSCVLINTGIHFLHLKLPSAARSV